MTTDTPSPEPEQTESLSDQVALVLAEARSNATYRLELLAALVLALATLGTAFSGYEASRWSGVQGAASSRSSALRAESIRHSIRGGQLASLDVSLFVEWLKATQAGDARAADYLLENMRAEFRPAMDAWLATDPGADPASAGNPFTSEGYRLESIERSEQLLLEAEAEAERAISANLTSDAYVANTVILAAALFFAGIVSRFRGRIARIVVILLATSMLIYGLYTLSQLPLA